MPPDEFARWITLMVAASRKKVQADVWQYASGFLIQEQVCAYETQELTGHRDMLMESFFFRTILIGLNDRFERVLEAAKTDANLTKALHRARKALRTPKFFSKPNIRVCALEIYLELRHTLRPKPTVGEVIDELPEVFRQGPESEWKRQWRRVRDVIRCVRGD
jgi:hypothetical protein